MPTTIFIKGTGKLIKFKSYTVANDYINHEHLSVLRQYIAYNHELYIDVE